jgi:hypothetical protein
MKKLLTKFRLSNALDDGSGSQIPDSLRDTVNASPELKDFSKRADALDRALRQRPNASPSAPSLHQSIMRAVRSSATEPAPEPMRFGFGLATLTAGLAVAAIAVWLAVRPSTPGTSVKSREQSLAAAQVVIDMGGQLPQSVPSVVSPLTNELACVDHDIQDTTKFVMAMLPSY